MKHEIYVSAPGKLILLGEHSVVYGKPALIAGLNKRIFIRIIRRKDKKIKIISKNYSKQIITNINKIITKFESAQKSWNKYNQNNDIIILKSITKELADYPQIIIGQFLNVFNFKTLDGFNLIIDSKIPLGAGMGSSGALAVSIIGALFLFSNKKFNKKIINNIAFLAEQKKHGKPSGGDNSASAFGGVLLFKKGRYIKTLNINLSPQISSNLFFINTGTPVESTGEMVGIVGKLNNSNPSLTEKIFCSQEKLVNELHLTLKQNMPGRITEIIKKSEANLEKLGVVSPFAQKIIKEIEDSGGAAKICGAGGKTKPAGIILIYHQNLQTLEKVLKFYSFKVERLTLGAEGLRIEI